MPDPVCVRCRGPLHTPEHHGAWACPEHGDVEPLHPALPPEEGHLLDVASSSGVPVWMPWPMPVGWSVSGVRRAGGTGPSRGVAVSLTGSGLTARVGLKRATVFAAGALDGLLAKRRRCWPSSIR